jgi:hypothetical protein
MPSLRPEATKVRTVSPLICGCPGLELGGNSVSATAPPRTPLVTPAIGPGWESFLQVPPPSSLRAQPCSLSFFLSCACLPGHRVVVAVPVATMAMTAVCTRTHPRTNPRAHAPTHAHTLTYARQGKVPLFVSSPPRAELASVSLAVDRGVAAREGFPPWKCNRPVAIEFVCLVASKPAWSPTGRGDPSRSDKLPSVRRGRRAPHAFARFFTRACDSERAHTHACARGFAQHLPVLGPRRAKGQTRRVVLLSHRPRLQPRHAYLPPSRSCFFLP